MRLSSLSLISIPAIACAGAFGTITYVTSGPVSVRATDLGGGRYSYVIQQTANGSGAVRFQGTSSTDVIEKITVFARPVVGDISFITLSFCQADGTMTTLGAVEEIAVINPADTVVSTGVVRISGDIGAPGKAFDLASMPFLIADGDLYADLIVDNRYNGATTNTSEITIAGSWLDGVSITTLAG